MPCRLIWHALNFCYVHERHHLPLVLNEQVGFSIAALLCQRGPSAIAGLVIAVIVDPVDGVI